MCSLKQYISSQLLTDAYSINEAISSGKNKKPIVDITIGKTTIPELEELLEFYGFTKTKEKLRTVKNYRIERYSGNKLVEIRNPKFGYEFTVAFGEPKLSGKLTVTAIYKFTDGNPFAGGSTPKELYEYIDF